VIDDWFYFFVLRNIEAGKELTDNAPQRGKEENGADRIRRPDVNTLSLREPMKKCFPCKTKRRERNFCEFTELNKIKKPAITRGPLTYHFSLSLSRLQHQ
jgi:hypothetical protein